MLSIWATYTLPNPSGPPERLFEGDAPRVTPHIRKACSGLLFANGGFDKRSAADAIRRAEADAIVIMSRGRTRACRLSTTFVGEKDRCRLSNVRDLKRATQEVILAVANNRVEVVGECDALQLVARHQRSPNRLIMLSRKALFTQAKFLKPAQEDVSR